MKENNHSVCYPTNNQKLFACVHDCSLCGCEVRLLFNELCNFVQQFVNIYFIAIQLFSSSYFLHKSK